MIGWEVRQPGVCPSRSGCSPRRGVSAMSGVEVGELPERGVDGERGVATPLVSLERIELRGRVRTLRRTITRVLHG